MIFENHDPIEDAARAAWHRADSRPATSDHEKTAHEAAEEVWIIGNRIHTYETKKSEITAVILAALTAAYEDGVDAVRGMVEAERARNVARLREMAGYTKSGTEASALKRVADEIASGTAPDPRPFQARVGDWMQACFGPAISADVVERNHRFLEESLELVQANGCTRSEAHQLVDYVYGRPVGDPMQEVGGVELTLAALCTAAGIDKARAAETELARVWTKVDAIRAKLAAKPKYGPLPGPSAPIDPVAKAREEERAACKTVVRGHVSDAIAKRISGAIDAIAARKEG